MHVSDELVHLTCRLPPPPVFQFLVYSRKRTVHCRLSSKTAPPQNKFLDPGLPSWRWWWWQRQEAGAAFALRALSALASNACMHLHTSYSVLDRQISFELAMMGLAKGIIYLIHLKAHALFLRIAFQYTLNCIVLFDGYCTFIYDQVMVSVYSK